MKYYTIIENLNFVGRHREQARLGEIDQKNEASITIVHGRRRIGKTELIEQYFRNRKVLKFEGLQCDPPKQNQTTIESKRQISHSLMTLSSYAEDINISQMQQSEWFQFFNTLTPYVTDEPIVLYFEEVQWLAAYNGHFFADMKPYWDNQWRHNTGLRIICSGSSPSFLQQQFLANKALYNRAQHTISLSGFTPSEVQAFLAKNNKNSKETLLAMLCVGGIPGYLNYLKAEPSILLGIAKHAFRSDSYFSEEQDKVFVSSLSSSKNYKDIIAALAKERFLTRKQIAVKVSSDGGGLSSVLDDLEQCGFIEKYNPLQKPHSRNLARYRITDEYLWFYYRFISPKIANIKKGKYDDAPISAIDKRQFDIALGFAFERWCLKNEMLLAKLMGFDQVEYQVGSFFNRKTTHEEPGFQIDLMYIRKDQVIVIAECKYYDGLVGKDVLYALQEKVEKFIELCPEYRHHSIQTALITPNGVKDSIIVGVDIQHVLTLDNLF